jgi:hypothetical protein
MRSEVGREGEGVKRWPFAPIDKECQTKQIREKYYLNYRRSKFRPHRRLRQGASLRRDHFCCSGFSGHSGFPVIADIWLLRLSSDIQLSGCSGFSPAVLATVDKFTKGKCIEQFAALPILYEIAY